MPLFDPTPDPRTPAQRIADQLRQSARAVADFAATEYAKNFGLLWQTPGIDPHDVIAALGTDAGPLFVASNTTLTVAGRADLLQAIPDRYAYVINPDGSMTLTDVPPTESA